MQTGQSQIEPRPAPNTWATTYRDNGQVAATADPNGVTTSYGYDGYGRLTGLTYTGGALATPGVTYAYDNANRRTSMADGTGTTTYTYDVADHLDTVTQPAGGSVQYGWDNAGRRTRVTHRAAGKTYNVAYGYDDANRRTTVTDWLNKTATYAYDDAGRLTGIAAPNGVASAYGYDPAGRLTSVAHSKGATPLASVGYTLDDAGNRLTETAAGVPQPGTTTYTYDELNRLATAAYPGGGTGAWGYDDVGNRTSVTTNGTVVAATYDTANRLTAQGTATYTNDNAGNRTGKVDGGVTTAYAYDGANRLKTVTTGSTLTATYTYDGDGYRTRKAVGATTNTYAWDRLGAGELGTVVGDGQAEYVFGPAGLQQRTVGAASQYAQGDGLGSVRLVTDGAGSASLGGFGFTGEQTDAETGLAYLRARHYDPATGRFIQAIVNGQRHQPSATTFLYRHGTRLQCYPLDKMHISAYK